MRMPFSSTTFTGLALMLLVCGSPALGGTFTFSNNNSTVTIVPTSQAGMNSWVVDGVDELAQQWFWYSIGSGSASSLDTLGTPVVTQTSNAFDSTLSVSYTGSMGLTATVTYVLTGGSTGSDTSDIGESIKLVNTSSSSMPLHFYQYSNFEVGGSTNNVLTFSNSNAVDQSTSTYLAETAVAPTPNEYEGGAYPSLLNLLNSGSAVTLSNTPGFGVPMSGDMTWSYEWDRTLAPFNGTLLISKDKNISPIPEPGTFSLLGGGAMVLLETWRRRRRRLARRNRTS
jgi:hypothetical protein